MGLAIHAVTGTRLGAFAFLFLERFGLGFGFLFYAAVATVIRGLLCKGSYRLGQAQIGYSVFNRLIAKDTWEARYSARVTILAYSRYLCSPTGAPYHQPCGFSTIQRVTRMPDWYRLDFPLTECCRNGKADQFEKALQAMFITTGRPNDAALFELHDDSCETNSFYVSPSGVALVKNLIENFGGVESAAPALSERLVLLVGHASFRESLQHDEVAKRRLSQIQIRGSIF